VTKYGDHISELMKVAQRGEEAFYDSFFRNRTLVPCIQATPV
jgi:hypothetical protein